MIKKQYLLILFMATLFVGCHQNQPVYDYSRLQQSNPKSILVLMPTNESLEVKGSTAVLANAVRPLSEIGYYVFPVTLVYETFKNNGLSEPFDIHQVSLHRLKEIFATDSVLYLNVREYGSDYAVLNSATKVTIDAKLVDVNNGDVLWEKSATAVENSSGGSSDLTSMLLNAIISQVVNTVSDRAFDLSRVASYRLFAPNCNDCLLFGPYSPYFNQDKQLGN